MDYTILKNPVFIYLRTNPSYLKQKIKYVELAELTGVSRHTATKLYEECMPFIDNKDYDIIINYHTDISDNILRAYLIYKDLNPKDNNISNIAKQLGISAKTLTKRGLGENNNQNIGVYGVFYNNKLLYIGSSDNIEERIQQHKRSIESDNGIKQYFHRYCNQNNIAVKDLEFRQFMIDKHNDAKKIELNLIKFLKPICNITGKE